MLEFWILYPSDISALIFIKRSSPTLPQHAWLIHVLPFPFLSCPTLPLSGPLLRLPVPDPRPISCFDHVPLTDFHHSGQIPCLGLPGPLPPSINLDHLLPDRHSPENTAQMRLQSYGEGERRKMTTGSQSFCSVDYKIYISSLLFLIPIGRRDPLTLYFRFGIRGPFHPHSLPHSSHLASGSGMYSKSSQS